MASATQTTPATQSAIVDRVNDHTSTRPSRGNFRNVRRGPRGDNFRELGGVRRRGGFNRGNYANGDNPRRPRLASGPENQPASSIPPPPASSGDSSLGARPTGDAETIQNEALSESKDESAEEDDVEAEVCFICASKVEHNSVAPCNHRTCHICALRLRALYKTRACAHCRVINGSSSFTYCFTDKTC